MISALVCVQITATVWAFCLAFLDGPPYRRWIPKAGVICTITGLISGSLLSGYYIWSTW